MGLPPKKDNEEPKKGRLIKVTTQESGENFIGKVKEELIFIPEDKDEGYTKDNQYGENSID